MQLSVYSSLKATFSTNNKIKIKSFSHCLTVNDWEKSGVWAWVDASTVIFLRRNNVASEVITEANQLLSE